MNKEEIQSLIVQMSLEEKAGLCSGLDNWNTKPIERLGVPSCRMSDGPHGLRAQEGGINSLDEKDSIPAVCFPSACATAASFDRQLLEKMGGELGRECQAVGVNVLLGPGINIKRSPLCGRNFEYFSEDPLLAGELGAAFVKGLQAQGAGASVKHFFANNQEHRRMDSSSEMDERTIREIYLPAWETVIKKAQPWTVMASYNKIDGTYSTANKKYLTKLLREEWGFDGIVVSDWGATHDRAAAVAAGCDLTMPAENTDGELLQAVRDGRLSEAELDQCCERILALAFRGRENCRRGVDFDYYGGHALARELASQSIVLLKNESAILPLEKNAKIAFIGGFAESPRYQGGGSSHINSFKVAGALEAAKTAGLSVEFAQGYNNKDGSTDDDMITEAVSIAKASDVAVVFAGLTDIMESEGVDRRHMKLPEGHDRLISAVCAVQPKTVVVLHNGSPVEMPWIDGVPAVVETYLGGQAIGEAVHDVLFGAVNPSGHLAESFPKKLSDNPSYLFYPGENGTVQYSERMFVGYRYYESKELETLFPFGHGLSYTSFSFDKLTADKSEMDENDTLAISVNMTNTGNRAGRALVQLYVAPPKGEAIRPLRELKGFEKISLEPNECQTVKLELSKRAFAHWHEKTHDWCVESGTYLLQIGANAHDILLEIPVTISAKERAVFGKLSDTTPMKEFAKAPGGKAFIEENLGVMFAGMAQAGFIPKELLDAIGYAPGSSVSLELIDMIAQKAGHSEGEGGGLDVLMNQSMSVMLNFLPEEKKSGFKALIAQINGTNN